jgi:hypothetical protein
MLTYKNDPLLLEGETANDLIESGKTDTIFLDKSIGILNLFSAFVKKSDFIKKDKRVQPLQTTVYVKVSKKLIDILQSKYSTKEIKNILESYTCRRSSVNSNINKWFEKRRIPIILLRAISKNNQDLLKFFNEIEYITDFLNKSRFYPPKTLDSLLTSKNVYLVGCSLGDGHINKKCKRWTLVEGTPHKEKMTYSRLFVERLGRLLKTLVDTYEIREYETKFALRINNKIFCRFLNFFFGLPIGKKKECVLRKPLILSLVEKDLEKYFWRGCFDTDGSINKQGALDFCSIDNNIKKECSLYLKKINIKPKMNKICVIIGMPELKKYSHIGLSHPRKQEELLTILKRGPEYLGIRIKENVNNIDPRLLSIYRILRVDKNYRIRIHYRNLCKEKISRDDIKNIIKELFGYDLKTTTKGLMYFKSKRIYDYLNNFFIFEPFWKPINSKEEIQLLNEWNCIWD